MEESSISMDSSTRRDPWIPQGLPLERHQECRHLHQARQEEDLRRHGCGLCPQEAGTYPLRIRRLNLSPDDHQNPNNRSLLGKQNTNKGNFFHYDITASDIFSSEEAALKEQMLSVLDCPQN